MNFELNRNIALDNPITISCPTLGEAKLLQSRHSIDGSLEADFYLANGSYLKINFTPPRIGNWKNEDVGFYGNEENIQDIKIELAIKNFKFTKLVHKG
jgi:hypothetical protein